MRPPRVALCVDGARDEAALARLRAEAERWLAAPVELAAVPGAASPGAARNKFVAGTRAPLIAFSHSGERPKFLAVAATALDRRPDWQFVVAGNAGDPREADPIELLARSWFAHSMLLMRRALGAFDESLDGAEQLDLLLRALADGRRGAVICGGELGARPFAGGRASEAGARKLLERHRALFAARAADAVVAKERELRELRAILLHVRSVRAGHEHELAALTDEAARLRAAAGRR